MKKHEGKIYFVSAPGRIKIGFTTKPEARLAQLRRMDMEELQVIHVVDSVKPAENMLHDLLGDHHIKGEWFTDCPEVRAVMDDFISGKIAFKEEPPAMAARGAGNLNYFRDLMDTRLEVANSAMAEAKSLAEEIVGRAERKEDIKDLVRQACFLATHVIGPLLYGSKQQRT